MMEAPHPELWVNVRPDNEVWGATAIRVAGVDPTGSGEVVSIGAGGGMVDVAGVDDGVDKTSVVDVAYLI